ncbi:MAG: DUF5011 domain-containing protein [Bacteroidetes bacterium]|nr:DUF5011 domain-containing protein [Bacteroidota bacterium]
MLSIQRLVINADYCSPVVNTLISDIGINFVSLRDIKCLSPSGIKPYTDYSNSQSTCLSLGGKYIIQVSKHSNLNPISRKVWIDFNQDGTFSQNEMIAGHASKVLKDWSDTIAIPNNILQGKTRMRIGVAFNNQKNESCGPNQFGEFEDYSIYLGPDQIPPVITLNGLSIDSVEQGKVYKDPGAKAWDDVDGFVKVTIVNTINSAQRGTYRIDYQAQDLAGNMSNIISRWVVVKPDNTGPTIALNGDSIVYVEVFNQYKELGATAYDSVYGQINSSSIFISGAVDTSIIGTYNISYSVCDSLNNCSVRNRKVVVGDTTRPIIKLIGKSIIDIDVHSIYVDSSVVAFDNYYKNLNLTSSNNINMNRVGTYTYTYQAIDGSGNKSIATRVVNVIDRVAPKLYLFGQDTMYVEAKNNLIFKDPGFYASDNYYTLVSTYSTGSVFVDKTYFNKIQTIKYTAIDGSGNISVAYRIVVVVKTTKPQIYLNGNSLVKSVQGSSYIDAGVTITDDYFSSTELLPGYSSFSNLNNDSIGVYRIFYHVSDPQGNSSDTIWRIIEVVTQSIGINNHTEYEGINLYPNPTSGIFSIEMQLHGAKRVSIEIMNQLGQIVYIHNKVLSIDSQTIDLSGYLSGVYHLRITYDGRTIDKNLILLKN